MRDQLWPSSAALPRARMIALADAHCARENRPYFADDGDAIAADIAGRGMAREFALDIAAEQGRLWHRVQSLTSSRACPAGGRIPRFVSGAYAFYSFIWDT